MTFEEFKSSLTVPHPPGNAPDILQAMWHQANGDWDQAHRIAQSQKTPMGDWVHAHLHRVEGDEGNAAYWYRRASKSFSSSSLLDEWEEITKAIIDAA